MIIRGYALLIGAALIILNGCAAGGSPSIYYTLQPAQMETTVKGDSQLRIGVGPVSLPAYLDRDAIVTRLSPNRLKVNDGHRWAGTLQEEILRILAANLKTACPTVTVRALPWAAHEKPDLRFRVTIQNFEGRRAGDVELKAAWSLEDERSDTQPMQRETHIRQAVEGDDFESLTTAMGLALAGLSREMAKDVAAFAETDRDVKPLSN